MPQRLQAIFALENHERVTELEHRRKLIDARMQFAALLDDDSFGSSCRQEMAKLLTAAEWQRLK
ncbi:MULTISPECIES: hypothetical protein [Lonsdalea]|uniref:Uncharacterized protein n=2 Tax=Lonsdalea TaxID=1082702 RepID=A0ACD1JAX5_9GAMM|nr:MULTISPECIES: hypothetical protein [Lonsdalea]RAT10778.1 hypothetical protein AU485_15820 [Lonsdalea quercina]RAT19082.1 hypothetical protein AU487_12540 [Lonsdalea populi]RAT20383.1 hypothetical protein AU489_16300 [Lonsdalea populi]RAT23496.1 hypothetical protein AU488_09670 [Lonsdalea populi]RAT32548.1 hypothetical protein AU492_12565 [Lonsdalea populi]